MYKLIHPSNVEEVWHLVAPWIAQAIGNSDHWSDLDNIKLFAKQGTNRIWIRYDEENKIDLVFVTQTWIIDGRNVCVIRWLAGKDVVKWLEDLALIENWAINNGFHAVHIWGRPGWLRACKPLGYVHEFTVISKPLLRGLN